MFRPLDKPFTTDSPEADLQDAHESARLDAQRTDDPCIEAEFGPLVAPETLDGRPACERMGYGANSSDPYEQAIERYHEPGLR